MQDSPGLKLDWLEEINLFAVKNSNKLLQIKVSKSYNKLEAETQDDNFSKFVYCFYHELDQH